MTADNVHLLYAKSFDLSDEDSDDNELFNSSSDIRHVKRWPPLGATTSSSPDNHLCQYESENLSPIKEIDRLKRMEREQEELNTSLLSLTTHFAQVQFRLKQIVCAPNDQKEDLLKELEEFAFKGIPDLSQCNNIKHDTSQEDAQEHNQMILRQREKQTELISQLKAQLEDLETFAYETGDASVPTSRVLEKQKVVIDQLRQKLSLHDLEHLDVLSSEELRETIDRAISQIVYPGKVKEKVIDQLKTQVTDLERFIKFLQEEQEASSEVKEGSDDCTCPKHSKNLRNKKKLDSQKNLRDHTLTLMRQAATLLQIFAITQFGCGTQQDFQRNLLKRTARANHWGDLRARLEMSISRLCELQQAGKNFTEDSTSLNKHHSTSLNKHDSTSLNKHESTSLNKHDSTSLNKHDSTSLNKHRASIIESSKGSEEGLQDEHQLEVTSMVRKELAVSLRDLLQHGLVEFEQSQSIVSFGCFSSRPKQQASQGQKMMHAWKLFIKYYEIKHGKAYSEAPARKLSMAYGLEKVGSKLMSSKQTLLTAIEEVSNSHKPFKRNDDSQFKAFISIALNQKKLVSWLKILLRSDWLIEYYYQPWSYVIQTGFDDALVSLDSLTKLDFDLPTDLAIRPFQNIKDAF